MKRAIFHPKAREAIKGFPGEVRYKIGKAIFFLQQGEVLRMPFSRSMPAAGKGVSELRMQGEDGVYRVFYLTKSEKGILVFHAFVKRTQKTLPLEIKLAKIRLRELLNG